MATEYPLVFLPSPVQSKKLPRSGHGQNMICPTWHEQGRRIAPKFANLQKAIDDNALKLKFSSSGIEPELALVFEVAGSLSSFYNTVKRIEGLEWIEDYDIDEVEPDDDFYSLSDGGEKKPYSSRVYCIMTNKSALDELVSYWNHYQEDENYAFNRGYSSLRSLFSCLREIRSWNAHDRLEDTGILSEWEKTAEIAGSTPITFEAELFFRKDPKRRMIASDNLRRIVSELDGRVPDECVIEEIGYHGMLIELPRKRITDLVSKACYDLDLINCEDVMFFRPVGQLISTSVSAEDSFEDECVIGEKAIDPIPKVAILDGLPLQNHSLLRDHLIVDDPDDFGADYQASYRRHGTAMASLVIHGDLENPTPINSKVYLRPVMKAYSYEGERFPKDRLFLDLVHEAVKRIFEGDSGEPPIAPSVKVINFSLGIPAQQYFGIVSPLAKMLDWLSYKYGVLFVVSAGNQPLETVPLDCSFAELRDMDRVERTGALLRAVKSESRNRKVMSPAESINSLTVGAVFQDASMAEEQGTAFLPVQDGAFDPISSFGPGVGRSIKPEVLYPGGRYFIGDAGNGRVCVTRNPKSAPGTKVATPGVGASVQSFGYESGTSVSAALITHEAVDCLSVLDEVFALNGLSSLPTRYSHLLVKAMLAHGAGWSFINDSTLDALGGNHKDVHQIVGLGLPDVEWAKQCSLNRITAIGFGEIGQDEGHGYSMPLPLDFSTKKVKRSLSVTLAYMSPVAFDRKEYRRAQLWFELTGSTKDKLVRNRQLTDYKAMRRGTLQHEVFEGEEAIPWDEEQDHIDITVSCSKTNDLSSLGSEKIPYALLVTFETAEGVDVYLSVANSLRTAIAIV